MKTKICMITGATSGIGKATALGLANLGATVVLVSRKRERGDSVLREIVQESGNQNLSLLTADLGSQKEVRQLAKDFVETHQRLDVLINNAGVFLAKRSITADGYETTFAVNHLAPFLLTNLLLDTLKASAPSRIVTVSSEAHRGETMNFDNLQGEKHYSGIDAYAQSKLANILFTHELARRIQGTGVTANCLHPGVIRTNLSSHNSLLYRGGYRLVSLFFASPRKGSETPIYLASSPEVEGVNGKYFVKMKVRDPSPEADDEAAERRLWQISEQFTSIGSE